MKILLFGKNGQVGWELQRSLAPLGEVVALDRSSTGLCGDLADLEGIARTVRQVRPTVLVNAAAYTAVDRAESEPERCRTVNALAPGVMAAGAQQCGAWMVHYSTDYVFDGSGQRAWLESDAVAPLGVYGATKAEGDQRVAEASARHLVLRCSWVYGWRGQNFIRTMLRLASERDRLTVVDDQFGAPTGADLIADASAHALRAAMAFPELAGTYHLAARGVTSWHGYAKHILALAGPAPGRAATLVDPVASSAYPTAARRPHNSRLDTNKLAKAFGLQLPPWQDGVERILAGMQWPADKA